MPAAQAEKNVFGDDAQIHPITNMPLEQGKGALPIEQQAELHCQHIERHHGKRVADAMRKEMSAKRSLAKADADLETVKEMK